MTRSRFRGTGPVGAAVVLTFLLGFISAPVRSCLTHQGHGHQGVPLHAATESGPRGTHAGHSAQGGPAQDTPSDGTAHIGCECLGLCQIEGSPPLPHTPSAAYAVAQGPEEVASLEAYLEATSETPHVVPLARGPPALV